MITIYGMRASGNCYKLQLLLDQLGREYRWVDVDSAHGATRTPEYLAKNPNGKVPLLELDDGRRLAESGAILCYLAEGTPFLPADHWLRAQTLQWMFFEQYSHEPCIAVARFIRGWLPHDHPRQAEVPALLQKGVQALSVMEQHLAGRDWFVGDSYGLADIALYAYTHCAGDGGFELSTFPNICAWLGRVTGSTRPHPDAIVDLALQNPLPTLPINIMSIPFALSARHKGFNRAEIVDQNFIEFVQLWQGDVRAAPRDSEAVLPGSALDARGFRELLESQLISRHLDLMARVLRVQNKVFYTIGSSGHEGNAMVARLARHTDPAFLHYRSGGFMAERFRKIPGMDPVSIRR